jgi:hypothetical protein
MTNQQPHTPNDFTIAYDEQGLLLQVDVALMRASMQGLVFGRMDDTSTFEPDIDLTPFNAREKGVSRRHAVLGWVDGVLHIIDLRSVNGTYIGKNRVTEFNPLPIHDGDTLRFGTFFLRIKTVI